VDAPSVVGWDGAGFFEVVEGVPCKRFASAARSVVKVLAGIEAASCLAGAGVPVGGGAVADLEVEDGGEDGAEEGAEDEGLVEFIGTAAFAFPATQPGTTSAGVALAGPSVTATQPGQLGNKWPGSTFS
jgi:hypothetical protein